MKTTARVGPSVLAEPFVVYGARRFEERASDRCQFSKECRHHLATSRGSIQLVANRDAIAAFLRRWPSSDS